MVIRVMCQLSVMCLLWTNLGRAAEPASSRTRFVEAINKIEEGMSDSVALALLGRRDRVFVEKMPVATASPDRPLREMWRYGVTGQPPIATLGEIEIDRKSRQVVGIVGQGKPMPEGLVPEQQPRKLLEALNQGRL